MTCSKQRVRGLRVRTLIAGVALALAASLTTACSTTDDDCGDQALSLAPVAVSVPLRPGPGGSRGSVPKPKPALPKTGSHGGSHHTTVHVHCDNED